MPCPPFLAAEWHKHHSSSIVLMNPNAATLPSAPHSRLVWRDGYVALEE